MANLRTPFTVVRVSKARPTDFHFPPSGPHDARLMVVLVNPAGRGTRMLVAA